MYNISALSSQNIYAPPASLKKTSNAAIDAVFAPSAAKKYEHTGGSGITADNFYATLAERAKNSAEKLAEYDFSDMYVKSVAHQFQLTETQRNVIRQNESEIFGSLSLSLTRKSCEAAKNAGCILVPIGPGEFPQFMDEIMQALSNGASLEAALDNKIEELKNNNISFDGKDFFYINPANGEVVGCSVKGRVFMDYDERFTDEDAVLELADDIATFLRYAAFPQENDDPERVDILFSYIKGKQAYANYDRYIFDYDLNDRVDNDEMAERIIDKLVAAGILKSEDDEEEEEDEAVDELLKAIKERLKAWKEERIDRKKSGFTVEEVKEILDGLKRGKSVTVK